MSINDLMKPRFELIADYPGNSQPIGNITIEDATASYFRKFPSNFRELMWYEKRAESDLPIHLKFVWEGKTEDVREVVEWLYSGSGKTMTGFKYKTNDTYGPDVRMSLDGWQPAIVSEYLSHLKKLETTNK